MSSLSRSRRNLDTLNFSTKEALRDNHLVALLRKNCSLESEASDGCHISEACSVADKTQQLYSCIFVVFGKVFGRFFLQNRKVKYALLILFRKCLSHFKLALMVTPRSLRVSEATMVLFPQVI